MGRGLYLVKDAGQKTAFSGLILPEVLPRLEEPAVFLVGAVEESRPVGAAVLELETDRAQLLSIAVTGEDRRQGVGSALLRQCVRALRRTSIQTLYAVLLPDEEDAAALFAAFGMAGSDTGSAHYRFTLGAAEPSILSGPGNGAVPLEEVPNMLFRAYIRKAFPADPAVGAREKFDPKVSRAFLEEGRVTACLLAEREGEGLSIGWLSSWSREKRAPLYLLRGALAAAREAYPPETPVSFTAYGPAVVRLADRLLGTAAEKLPVRKWILAEHRFRLIDTTPAGWEEDT